MGEIMKVSYKIGEIEFEAVGDAAFINEQSRYFVEFLRGEYGKQCKTALRQNAECACGQQVTLSVPGDNETVIPDNETENHNNGTEEPDSGTEITDNGTPAAVVESVENAKPPVKKKKKALRHGQNHGVEEGRLEQQSDCGGNGYDERRGSGSNQYIQEAGAGK